MTVVTKIPRGRWFQGADTEIPFLVEHEVGEDPGLWEFQFVMRRPSLTCPGREDPGDGALVLMVNGVAVQIVGDLVTVTIARADTVNLEPDDYYCALWRIDDGNDRPLCVLRYAHLTAAPWQDPSVG